MEKKEQHKTISSTRAESGTPRRLAVAMVGDIYIRIHLNFEIWKGTKRHRRRTPRPLGSTHDSRRRTPSHGQRIGQLATAHVAYLDFSGSPMGVLGGNILALDVLPRAAVPQGRSRLDLQHQRDDAGNQDVDGVYGKAEGPERRRHPGGNCGKVSRNDAFVVDLPAETRSENIRAWTSRSPSSWKAEIARILESRFRPRRKMGY